MTSGTSVMTGVAACATSAADCPLRQYATPPRTTASNAMISSAVNDRFGAADGVDGGIWPLAEDFRPMRVFYRLPALLLQFIDLPIGRGRPSSRSAPFFDRLRA